VPILNSLKLVQLPFELLMKKNIAVSVLSTGHISKKILVM